MSFAPFSFLNYIESTPIPTPTGTVTPTPTPTITPTPTPTVIPISQSNLTIYADAKFNNSYSGSGTTWYSIVTGTTYNATLYNSPTFVSSSPKHFSFDGSNDYALFDAAGKGLNNTSKSFGGWVELSNNSTLKSFYFRGFDEGGSNGWSLSMIQNTNNKLRFSLVTTSPLTQTNLDGGTTISSTNWYYVFATFNYSTGDIKIYLNGVLDASGNLGANKTLRNSTTGWYLSRANNTYTQVKISDFEFYDAVELSSTTILNNFNAQKSNYGY